MLPHPHQLLIIYGPLLGDLSIDLLSGRTMRMALVFFPYFDLIPDFL